MHLHQIDMVGFQSVEALLQILSVLLGRTTYDASNFGRDMNVTAIGSSASP